MARVLAREISTPARRSWPTAHGSCPAARCEAPAVAQGYPFPTLFPFRFGQSHSFRALSIWHGSLLGKFRPRLGEVGPRLTARALRLGARPRPWLKATLFPFRSGQSHSFCALSIWHGSLLGKFRPRLGGVGPRLTARALRLGARPRPWLKATLLPFRSGQSHSFCALSIWHGSLLGQFRPRLPAVGPPVLARALRLGARPRPWLKATLLPFRSGQSHSFCALSIWHGSLLGKFRPRLGGVGPRLTARALRLGARPRPWLMAGFFLPFAHLVPADHILFGPLIYPTSHGSGVLTPARGEAPATTSLCFQKLQFIWPSTKL